MKHIARITALVLATITGLILLWQFRQGLVVFLLSLAVAAAARPVISAMERRGIRHSIALLITYLVFIGLVTGLLVVLGGKLGADLEQVTNRLATAYETAAESWPKSENMLQAAIGSQLPPARQLFDALGGEEGRLAIQNLLGTASSMASFFSQGIVILILSLYWSADRVRFERLWLSLIPVNLRTQARSLWRDVETGVGSYILGEVVQSYLAVLILWVGFTWIGLPQPALFALTGALFWFIPWLGAVLAVVPVVLSGLTVGLPVALGGAAITVATLALLELFVQPLFFSRQRFNSLFLVLVVIIMTQAFGLPGLILGPALAAALEIGFQNLVSQRERQMRSEEVNEQIRQVRASLNLLQKNIHALDSTASPELANLAERLQGLMEKTVDYLAESGELSPTPVTIREKT